MRRIEVGGVEKAGRDVLMRRVYGGARRAFLHSLPVLSLSLS